MKNYTVKEQYLSNWGEWTTTDTVVSEDEVNRLAEEWDKPVDELLAELDEIQYKPVIEAEQRQEGAPATAYWAIDAVNAAEKPDEYGMLPLFELVYYGDDPETIDWDEPDEIRTEGYQWDTKDQRKC